jgi:hypothetical protein
MWLRKKLRPAHQTLANVRRDPLESRRDVWRTLTRLCKQLDLFGGELVVIDGSQFRAVNATGRHVTTATLAQLMARIEARVAGSLNALEAADAQDEAGTPGGARAADLQTKIAARRGRRLRDKDLQAKLERRGHDQLSLTAPDRRSMQGGHGGGTAVCDHVQTAVEANHNRIVAGEVANDPTDRDGLSPVALEAKAVLGGACEAVADVSDDHGQEVQPCLHVGMTPSLARPIPSANQTLGLFSTDDCTSEAAADTDGCPAGEVRSWRCATIERGRHIRD